MRREILIETVKPIVLLLVAVAAFTVLFPQLTGRELSFGPPGLYIFGLIAFSFASYIQAVRKVWKANQ